MFKFWPLDVEIKKCGVHGFAVVVAGVKPKLGRRKATTPTVTVKRGSLRHVLLGRRGKETEV